MQNAKCYYMEMFLFRILKNCVSIQSMQNGDEWKTQEKKKKQTGNIKGHL